MTIDRRTRAGICMLLLAMVVVLGTAGCVSQDTPFHPTIQEQNNISWYNYDIFGSPLYSTVNHTYAAKDNFYAYANAESLKSNAMSQLMMDSSLLSGIIDRLGDDSSATGTEADLLRTARQLSQDTETRERLGVTPVLPAVEEIRAVSTLDELSALISSGGSSSLREAFVRELAFPSFSNGSVMDLYIYAPEFVLANPALYRDMTPENAVLYAYLLENFQKFLVKCGYTQEEAEKMAVALKDLETTLAPLCLDINAENLDPEFPQKADHPYTYEQFSRMAFPIAGDLKDYHDAGVTRFVVINPAWLDKLNELYTPENLDAFKAAMLYELYRTATPFLDTETVRGYFGYECLAQYPVIWKALNAASGTPAGQIQNQTGSIAGSMQMIGMISAPQRINNEYLGMAIGRVLSDTQIPAGTKEEYNLLIREIIEAFKERVTNADWLSDSTRAAALEKVDRIKVRTLYPDDWSYYSYDDVDYKDAGTFYNLSVQLRKHNQAEVVKDALQTPSASVWPKSFTFAVVPQTVNAFYEPRDNSINMLYGYLAPLIRNQTATYEDIQAVAGTVIAHEITHGFDPLGSRYAADGSYVNWWTDSDRRNFEDKGKQIAAYFSGFEARPGEYLQGDRMTGEIIADLGGFSTVLDIARTKEDFDYDRFFSAYARNVYMPVDNATYSIFLADTHLPGMYRVNGNMQQYDEFYDTYGITEGDQMYLAPENRLTLW